VVSTGNIEGFRIGVAALAVLAVTFVSGIDDVRSLPSQLRLIVHLACAAAAVAAMAYAGREAPWSPAIFIVAVLWVIGLTNAYNFMDGIDGIAGAQAIVTGVAVAVASHYAGLPAQAVAGTATAAASAGFLVHNWAPAKVFMGDVGAVFLGFSFAVLALDIGAASFRLAVAVVLSLWPFLFDTGFTLLRRLARREDVLESHRSHLYQRLVIAGWPHGRVSLSYAAGATVGLAAGISWALGLTNGSVLTVVPVMALALWTGVVWTETSHANHSKPGDAGVASGR
jgi:UDP-N-acetylmuramyl pentapeptide phosphotransferase/UDP-N-acetylglucosamine-1-phosphate transferase